MLSDVLLLRVEESENWTTVRGSCEDLTERIRRHKAGDSKATKHGAPWVLVHSESFASRSEAAQRERYYKTQRGRDELDKLW
jgi:putative endonuclease